MARKDVYCVYYKNWRGEWTKDVKEYATLAPAKRREKVIAKTKAQNGRTTVQIIN